MKDPPHFAFDVMSGKYLPLDRHRSSIIPATWAENSSASMIETNSNAVVSGEVRQTLIGLAGLWKGQAPEAAEGQSGPTLGPDSGAQDAIPPVVQQDQAGSSGDEVGS